MYMCDMTRLYLYRDVLEENLGSFACERRFYGFGRFDPENALCTWIFY